MMVTSNCHFAPFEDYPTQNPIVCSNYHKIDFPIEEKGKTFKPYHLPYLDIIYK